MDSITLGTRDLDLVCSGRKRGYLVSRYRSLVSHVGNLCYISLGTSPDNGETFRNTFFNSLHVFEESPQRAARILFPSYMRICWPFFILINPFLTLAITKRTTIQWYLMALASVLFDFLYCKVVWANQEMIKSRLRLFKAHKARIVKRKEEEKKQSNL